VTVVTSSSPDVNPRTRFQHSVRTQRQHRPGGVDAHYQHLTLLSRNKADSASVSMKHRLWAGGWYYCNLLPRQDPSPEKYSLSIKAMLICQSVSLYVQLSNRFSVHDSRVCVNKATVCLTPRFARSSILISIVKSVDLDYLSGLHAKR